MKYFAALLVALVAGCTVNDSNSDKLAVEPAPATLTTTTDVLAEPLPGKQLRISVTAQGRTLFIVNCNEHIVVSLRAVGASDIAWGGASNACLSQSIIIPSGATLTFVVALSDGSPELDTNLSYTALIGGVHTTSDIRSPQVPAEHMTSNVFKILP